MNKNKIVRSKSSAFTLIEMIGVLAIIGILASVVSPKVIEAIRDAKVTGVIANLAAAKTAAATYYGRYNIYPVDGTKLAVVPGSSNAWTRTYGQTVVVTTNTTSFGDLLVSEGLLENIKSPVGLAGTNTPSLTATQTNTSVLDVAVGDYPMIFSRVITGTGTNNFTGAASATRTILLYVPGISLNEAAALKTKIDGPFANEAYAGGAGGLVRDTANGLTTGSPLIGGGNCKLELRTGALGVAGSTYDAFLYVQND